MADLIDRQAAIEKLTNNLTYMHTFGADISIDLIEELPSVEAEPVRHGKWERHYIRPNVYADLYWHCSCCGGKLADEFANHYKYCPDCGAKMDEVTSGD